MNIDERVDEIRELLAKDYGKQPSFTDESIINIMKAWYTSDTVENLLFRNSPVVKKL